MKQKMYAPKKLDISNTKSCFKYLNEHYNYYTLNSWNGLKSIANNVKLYNLGLDGDWYVASQALDYDNYEEVNRMLIDWEYDHPGYEVGFNGRGNGYLVLTNKHNNKHVLPDELIDYDYEHFKQYCKDYYGSIKNYKSELLFYVKLVRDFDNLCDDIRDYVNELSKMNYLKEVIDNELNYFNDDYYDELNEFNLEYFVLNNDNKIMLSEKTQKHNSLINLLIQRLNKINGLKIDYKQNYIEVKEV